MIKPRTTAVPPASIDTTSHGSVGIVADDLTGANDSAVKFARAGWVARLALADVSGAEDGGHAAAADRRGDGTVVAVVTDARAQSAVDAQGGTARAVRMLARSGASRLFVKIDSTMRGTVTDQVAGALEAWQVEHPGAFAVVCPAYPAMGRTVESGRLLVNGAGVETTSVGRDPVTPVSTSSLAQLLPGSTNISSAATDAAALAASIGERAQAGASVITVDASTDADLTLLADAIVLLGPRAVPVGSAGLAVDMSRVWGEGLDSPSDAGTQPSGPGGVVVVVSSLHDVSREQYADLVAAADSGAFTSGVRTLAPTLHDLLVDGLFGFLDRELATSDDASVTVVLAPAERVADEDSAQASAGMASTSERIAAGLATITDAVFEQGRIGSLVLMGGEGARAVLDRFGADSILVRDSIQEGIPIGAIEGGRLHGLLVVTKAGGFGAVSSLTEIAHELVTNYVQNTTQGEPT